MAAHHLGLCGLSCGELATTTVCGYQICDACVQRIRAIAHDAGVAIDEELISGQVRQKLSQRQMTRAERTLEDNIERREIAAARGSA